MRSAFFIFLLVCHASAALAAPQLRTSRLYEQWKKADASGDGALSRSEAAFAPRLARHFDTIDRNADGRISAEEVRSWNRTLAASRRRPQATGVERFIRHADIDGNATLDRAEVEAGLPRLARKFDRLDANRDGVLAPDELESWLALRRAARRR